MHAISSYRGNRPTYKQTNIATKPQTGPITIHCAAKLSAQCKDVAGAGTMVFSAGGGAEFEFTPLPKARVSKYQGARLLAGPPDIIVKEITQGRHNTGQRRRGRPKKEHLHDNITKWTLD